MKEFYRRGKKTDQYALIDLSKSRKVLKYPRLNQKEENILNRDVKH